MRMTFFLSLFLFFITTSVYGVIVSNPSDPCLYTNGLISSNKKNYSFRASFLYNNLYKGSFKDKTTNPEASLSDIQYKLISTVLTLNAKNRLDIYAILGTSNIQIDQIDEQMLSMNTDRRFAWGTGFKTILFQYRCLDFSFDGKYYTTTQKPQYFVIDKNVYPLAAPLPQKLQEFQASLALSYKTRFLIPYIGSTYLYSTLTPISKLGLMILPGGALMDFQTNDCEIRKNWGMVFGLTIINRNNQATLTIESRAFDQNAFAFIGTFRF